MCGGAVPLGHLHAHRVGHHDQSVLVNFLSRCRLLYRRAVPKYVQRRVNNKRDGGNKESISTFNEPSVGTYNKRTTITRYWDAIVRGVTGAEWYLLGLSSTTCARVQHTIRLRKYSDLLAAPSVQNLALLRLFPVGGVESGGEDRLALTVLVVCRGGGGGRRSIGIDDVQDIKNMCVS